MVNHISLFVDNRKIQTKFIEFSDGAVNIQLLEDLPFPQVSGRFHLNVEAGVPTPAVLQELALYANLVASHSSDIDYSWSIHFDYHPYARADRRFGNGEPFCLYAFVDAVVAIFGPSLSVVTSVDVHSEVTEKLWQAHGVYFAEASQASCLGSTLPRGTTYEIVVAPDKGAKEKAAKCRTQLKALTLLEASKVRDAKTGRITSTELPPTAKIVVPGQDVLIVDDICDGGGTFLPLAEALKAAGAREVHLYVTHGIFSKGLGVFSGYIDKIFCYHTVGGYVTKEQIWSFNESTKEIN